MTAEPCGRARGLVRGVLGLVLAALLADDCAAQAAPTVPGASQRVALVIGNSRYPAEPLPSAARDAAAVAEKLRGMGYSVRSFNDLTKEQMQAAYRQHVQDLVAGGGVGVIYFARPDRKRGPGGPMRVCAAVSLLFHDVTQVIEVLWNYELGINVPLTLFIRSSYMSQLV